MNEQEIQKISRQVAQQVYMEMQTQGQFSPIKIPLHTHNGVDNNKVPIQNIKGVQILETIGEPSDTIIFSAQLIGPNNGQNSSVFSVPLPVLENASAEPFVLGTAPDGTLILGQDITTIPATVYLFGRVGGLWYSTILT
jgi:hypothetical protein